MLYREASHWHSELRISFRDDGLNLQVYEIRVR